MIYELKFSYYEDNSENNDEIIIAVYSSYKKAEIGKKKFSQQPRFKGKEEFWKLMNIKSMKQSGMKVFGEQQNHIL